MTLTRAIEAADTLKDLFEIAMREAVSNEDLGAHLRGSLAHWQKHKPAK